MKNGAIVLARMDSSRLPGKANIMIHGKTLLEWCIESLKGKSSYEIIIATTTREIDIPIVEIAKRNNIAYFQGSITDVAKRTLDCAKKFRLDNFARVNGDSPFIRRQLLNIGFDKITNPKYDFVTNLIPRHFPYGISVEIFKTKIFEQVYTRIKDPSHKEHVTSYFYEHLSNFHAHFLKYPYGNDHNIRLVIDTEDDLVQMKKLIKLTSSNMSDLELKEILHYYLQ